MSEEGPAATPHGKIFIGTKWSHAGKSPVIALL